jgi:cytochrome P450
MDTYAPLNIPSSDVPENVPLDRVFDVDAFNLAGIEDGYQEACKRLQGPGMPNLIWTPRNGGHWIVTRGNMVREVLRDPTRFSSGVIVLPKEAGEKYDLLPTRLDPPEHTEVRAVANKVLNLREIRRIEDPIREIAVELIEPLVPLGQCDFSEDYAQKFPIRVFMTMVDLPMKDAALLKHYATQILRPDGTDGAEMAVSVDKAVQGFYAYLDPVIEARRGGNGTDMITRVLNSQINGEPISKVDALSLMANLLLAGLDTVVSFLSFVMLFLGRNPEHLKQLSDDLSLIPHSVEELLRRFPIVSDARIIAHDIEYDGVQLKRGDMIQVPTALSGLDEEMNDDPWKVVFGRKRPEHSTFGDGPHRCAGMHLARMEITITLHEWLSRIPSFRVAQNAAPRFSSGMVAMVEDVPLEWDVA